ncbi:hypothetical protein [Longimonas halophila]|uniref:hypothetical protein n=1 Tax=Longimonas halophila TaxID=1469170 RepID=UPI001142038A|nr:hypothetical protein [Longimonas halophila]
MAACWEPRRFTFEDDRRRAYPERYAYRAAGDVQAGRRFQSTATGSFPSSFSTTATSKKTACPGYVQDRR